MIPRKLVLRNFMCYRGEVELDFSAITIACISGENGAGKSALLDAITWTLWGKARAATADELIALGADDLAVDFQFALGHEQYRVLRQRRRGKTGTLEVQIRELTPDGVTPWRPITGDNLAQTQRLLTRAIGMEYDTFINSAFVLQGRADEFTTRRPAERKQVLADILGLSRYDELEERARELRRAREQARHETDRELERITGELAGRAEKEATLATLTVRLQALQEELSGLDDELASLTARRTVLETRAGQAGEAEARARDHAAEAEALRQRLARSRARLEQDRAIVATANEIRAGAAALDAAEADEARFHTAVMRQRDLEGARRAVEDELAVARGARLQELHALEHELGRLRESQATLPALEHAYAEWQATLAELTSGAERRDVLRQSLESANEELQEKKAENSVLKQQMDLLKERQTQLLGAAADCPVCRRPLDETERARLRDEYQTEGKQLGDRYRANQQRCRALTREIEEARSRIAALDRQLREQPGVIRQVGSLEQQLATGRRDADLIASREAERDRVAAVLATNDFAHDAHARLVTLDAELAALQYDRDAHEVARRRVESLRPFRGKARELAAAEKTLPDLEAQLAEDEQALARRSADQQVELARAAELRAGTEALPGLIARFDDLSAVRSAKTWEQAEVTSQHGATSALLARLTELEETARQLRAERRRLADEETIYRELGEAFGKRGIQAMIIEAAVPEIQDEANAILRDMPGNTMQVEFRTQRETQKGELVEALDIRISDEAGARDYALYSGGESFRVNFAIRVALSKLLTRRAGAKLQTLVIDEGFGTQDTRGRDGIVEAIRAIEGDFATILIITHINDLKEAFPTQIVVDKTPTGSRINVV